MFRLFAALALTSVVQKLYRFKSYFIGLIIEMEQQIAVFGAFRPFLRILTVYNANNFRNKQHRFKNICLAIACFIFLVNLLISVMAAIWHCIALKFDLGQAALPFALLINSVQMLITYISIEIKNKQIEATIAGLIATIHKRKPLKCHFQSISAQFNTYAIFSIGSGCRLSAETRFGYNKLEQKFARIVSFIVNFCILVNVVFFTASAMIPVFYAIFNYPQPHQWRTMFEYR